MNTAIRYFPAFPRISWKPYLLPLALISVFILISAAPEAFAPYRPNKLFDPYMELSAEHILGTDDMGRDLFSLLVYAARNSMLIGFASGALAVSIGVAIGLVSGWYRGLLDDVLMGATDIVLIIPKIPLAIILAAYLKPGPWILILVLGLLSWEGVARVIRSRVLQVRSAEFILSAQCLGFSRWYIMTREVLPVIFPLIVPKFVLMTAGAMLSESSLSFLGLTDTTMLSWGTMISESFTYSGFIRGMWNWWLPPALCIILSILAVTSIAFIHERGRRVVIQS